MAMGEVFTPRRVIPVMAPGLISLVLGGLGGIGIMWSWAGTSFPIKLEVTQHFYLMIAGFFAALIGNELLNVLSMEWSGRQAGGITLALYAALLWALLAGTVAGAAWLSSAAYLAMLLVLITYSRTYLKPSKMGFRPSAYNYLIVASLAASIALYITAWIGGGDLGVAMLIFPVSMIYAVMARDIALVTGRRPARERLGVLAFLLLVASFAMWTFGIVEAAGALLAASGAASILFSGVAQYARTEKLFSYVKIWSAYLWLMAAGLILFLGAPTLWRDVATHALALGFIFNIVFGVDVILIDMIATQMQKRIVVKPRRGVPILEVVTFLLLNVGMLARAGYAYAYTPSLAVVSGPLVGIAIVAFLLYTQRRLMQLSA
ncbi:TPA: hypothetical protein HA333_10480 [Pyrobaculum aerophilum]|uniref:Uncharacterized protein n=2 Tax=Pyrobaculum aerophilum TaxID=13773 RepID=A0A832SXQ0_9CREN|nr:hypothetical protein [Pyrobaculum aerophilum]